jgi:hypothetical protein
MVKGSIYCMGVRRYICAKIRISREGSVVQYPAGAHNGNNEQVG